MIPLRDPALATGRRDDLTAGQREIDDDELLPLTAGWALTRPALAVPAFGTRLRVQGRDTVSSGPELARLTMNIAAVHHDAAAAGGRRLVYGGHTIALASRRLPGRSRTCSRSWRGTPATIRRRCTKATCCRAWSR
jgi:hypothetical protein